MDMGHYRKFQYLNTYTITVTFDLNFYNRAVEALKSHVDFTQDESQDDDGK